AQCTGRKACGFTPAPRWLPPAGRIPPPQRSIWASRRPAERRRPGGVGSAPSRWRENESIRGPKRAPILSISRRAALAVSRRAAARAPTEPPRRPANPPPGPQPGPTGRGLSDGDRRFGEDRVGDGGGAAIGE